MSNIPFLLNIHHLKTFMAVSDLFFQTKAECDLSSNTLKFNKGHLVFSTRITFLNVQKRLQSFFCFVFLNTQNFEWSLVGGSSNFCLIVSGSTVGPRYVSDSGFSPAGKLPAQTSCMLGNAVQSLVSWSQSALRNISVSFMIPCS